MNTSTKPTPTLWLRILQSPLTRLLLLGSLVFFMMGTSNGFMAKFAGSPLKS